jgi:hypothetical protein
MSSSTAYTLASASSTDPSYTSALPKEVSRFVSVLTPEPMRTMSASGVMTDEFDYTAEFDYMVKIAMDSHGRAGVRTINMSWDDMCALKKLAIDTIGSLPNIQLTVVVTPETTEFPGILVGKLHNKMSYEEREEALVPAVHVAYTSEISVKWFD